jgi:hypothetical protein
MEVAVITRAYVQEQGNGRLGPEERDLIEGLGILGIPTELFTRKQIARRRLPLDRGTLVAGDVTSVLGALRQLGIESPRPNDYPACVRHLLRRRIWPSTVRRLKESLFEGAGSPVFAKPSGRQKRFTGQIFASPADLIHLEGASGSMAVHCAEPVCWASEHRVYVVRGRVVGIRHYAGDPAVAPDEAVVSEAVRRLEESGESTAGYGLDVGVLDDGRTALAEWNDGYSLGSYGLDASTYTRLILARWCELVGCG